MQSILNQPETWGLLLGLITPLAVSVVQQPGFSKPVRTIVGAVCALIVGTVTVLADGHFDTSNWFATVAICLVAAQVTYNGFWKPSGVARVIELATARNKRPSGPSAGGSTKSAA